MKELWIHAGMPKNGTSALQVFFAKNIKNLEKEGIDYINLENIEDAKKGFISSGNAAVFAKKLRSDSFEDLYNETNGSYQKLLTHIKESSFTKFLLSSEFFATVPAKRYKKMIDDLKELDVVVKIIYYVRRQDQFLMSAYMQEVKRNRYTGYPEEFVLKNYKKWHLNYYDLTKNFVHLFGKANVKVSIYDSTKTYQYGIVEHFLFELLQYTPEWIYSEKYINTSPSPYEIKMMLFANQYKPRMKFSDILVENSAMSNRSRPFSQHNILSIEMLKMIDEYYQESNKLFEKEFIHNTSFPPYNFEFDYVDLKELRFDVEDVLDIITGFLVYFDKKINIK